MDEAANNLAPVVAGVLPFLALSGACISFLILAVGGVPWVFGRLPLGFRLKFNFYRNHKVKELYPVLQDALKLDSMGSYQGSLPISMPGYVSQLKYLKEKFAAIEIDFEVSIYTSGGLMRDIGPFVKEGSYKHVRRICDEAAIDYYN